ncbi:hypothetical protein HY78_24460 [Rhizorhabdus wittichii DC-6]|jgi:hypothetical protein|uniref:Uncharacterized protein n=2 Tax=Sphingomonadales TaxID=204457 RepID=U2YHD9_9SPHN|nr:MULTISPECIES: hypothetical protein [Sphingomonadales]ARR56384.1 hypothetical protein HY78_24460 [Rhizorhabdus wittichii DC-6]EZP70544.1 hypothetical protein BV96_03220 [Sphingomonas paucimobilis]AMK24709.1 hypothetical protein K426_18900 [Sphingobium sp. TKS]AZI37453.1 hypothetical protein EGO55_16965 [Caenibius tardaugens NBRC 16725]QTH22846.1 hypothetical protein HRJ34_04830 [Rhizorhabdus wittichii]
MDIFVANGTHFSQPSKITSYHTSEREARIAATRLVNQLRADLDSEALPPIDVGSWEMGLIAAQCRHLAALGIDISDMDHDDLADAAGCDVWIEKADLQGVTVLALNDRELSTVLAALRDHQRCHCGADLDDVASNLGRHEPLTSDEIDGLCMRINGGELTPQEANVVIELDGGLVQGIIADRPITVRVVDYDVEGADPDDLLLVSRDNGDPVPASISSWAVEDACIDPDWIARLDAASASDGRATAQMAAE